MKDKSKKPKDITKGKYRAFVISVGLHLVAFILAGTLVVFTVLKPEEQEFKPPPLTEKPKMKLKKPKIKVKKSKPKQTRKIITKSNKSPMPTIDLPEMSGLGNDIGGGVDGFDEIPDLGRMTTLGSAESIGNDFVGTLYDLKYTRAGQWSPLSEEEWRYEWYRFFSNDWDTRLLSKYYRSPNKLYATYFVLPPTISAMAPVAFGMSDKMASGGEWILHYKGKLVHDEGITFRFWVAIDDALAIRVDGEVVIAASFINSKDGSLRSPEMHQNIWTSSSIDTGKYLIGQSLATVGDWITLEPGVAKDMEVIITDNVAANAHFMVLVQEKGVEYPRGRHNGPLLPIFKTEPLNHDQLDMIFKGMAANEIDCTNGPVFRDY